MKHPRNILLGALVLSPYYVSADVVVLRYQKNSPALAAFSSIRPSSSLRQLWSRQTTPHRSKYFKTAVQNRARYGLGEGRGMLDRVS